MTLRMLGAIPPLPCMPLWHVQGHFYLYPEHCLVRWRRMRGTGHIYTGEIRNEFLLENLKRRKHTTELGTEGRTILK
jgi:hypothetical protein